MHMTFQAVPQGFLFSSTRTGKKCSYIKLRTCYRLKGSKSLREQERKGNAVLFGPGEPLYFESDERVEDIAEPTQEGAAVALRTTFFVFSGSRLVEMVNAVATAPEDSGVLIYHPL